MYCDIKPTHLDRNPDENSMKKIIIDNYILSQKTETIYISEYSNFGKIAVLSGNHKNIYNTKMEKISKKYVMVVYSEVYNLNNYNYENRLYFNKYKYQKRIC